MKQLDSTAHPASPGEKPVSESSRPDIFSVRLADTLARYRQHALSYDASAQRTMWIRRRTIDKLELRPGDRVLDIACGTGLSLDALQQRVGPNGAVFGIEVSPEMIDVARQRVASNRWQNVHLHQAAVEEADIPGRFDAVLFHFTHDVMRSKPALQRVFASLKSDARVAMAGMKFAPRWMAPVNVIVRAQARPYMATFDGLETPWDLAMAHVDGFERQSVLFGTGYIGWGRVRARPGPSSPAAA